MGGGSSFICRNHYLEALGLEPASLGKDRVLEEEELSALDLAREATEAEIRAVALLARAEQGRHLLQAKLEKRELSRPAIRLALDWLEAQGLLDDGRYAESWLRSKMGSAAATPAKLLTGLRGKGIDEAVAKAALGIVFGVEERKEALAKAWERCMKRAGGDKGEAKAGLRALGFKAQEIREYFEDLEP